MHRRDYIILQSWLLDGPAEVQEDMVLPLAREIASLLDNNYPNFNRDRFLEPFRKREYKKGIKT
jgi:hypothetical protein